VLLHGGVLAGELCWRRQLQLADRFTLEIVDRAGYGPSQQVSPGEDLDADAPLVAGLLTEPAHLVGHSSGAVAAMLAAALRPVAVLSLTLCEPPAFQLAPGSAQAQQMAHDLDEHLHRPGDDAQWLRGFLAIVGRDIVIPDQLPPRWPRGAGDPRGPPPPVAGGASGRPARGGIVSQARHLGQPQPRLRSRLRCPRGQAQGPPGSRLRRGPRHARYRRCIQRNPRGIHQHSAAQNSISLLNQRSTTPKTAKVEK
jgi:pimeloyl-ACP methyl ester carboxylesterase